MSDIEDLIARLRNQSGVRTADVNERVKLMDEAADTLEKVTAERDAARRRNAELTRSSNEKNDTIDALAAQLENVRGSIPDVREGDPELADFFDECVSIAPSVALDRVKAEALREAADYLDSFEGPGGRQSAHDRAGRDIIRLIRDRADHIEKDESNDQ